MGKILFYPVLSVGHLNIGLTISKEILKKYGDKHQIHVIVNKLYHEKLSKKLPQLKYELLKKKEETEDNEDEFVKMMGEFGKTWNIKDRVEFIKKSSNEVAFLFNLDKEIYDEISGIIQRVKPDIILCDHIWTVPNGIDQGIPYAYIVSGSPTFLGHPQLPPFQSGFSSKLNDENMKKWDNFISEAYKNEDFKKIKKLQNDWLKEKNCKTVDSYYLFEKSPYFNIYNYPSAVNYFNDQIKLPGDWLKLESAITPPLPAPFKIPEKLSELKGKLIYVSMGSMSSGYKPLMDHLINVISQLPHRFILSAGFYCDEYKLSENIYAEKFLDQLAVLQTVDLMISHGGNNTFTECFYFGVPQIILPLFADQIDNAAQIKEKGLGETFSAFECTKEQISEAIEKLSTKEIKEKYKEISSKIQQDKSIDKVCEKIVSYCK